MIHSGSCHDILPTLPPESVDLIVTDPPYNIGENYAGYCDTIAPDVYLDRLRRTFRECRRVLEATGSIIVIQGDAYAAETRLILDEFFLRRQWCIWHYTFGVQCKAMFARSHVHVFYYTMSTDFTFNADAVRVPSARQAMGDPRANPAGKLPDDVMTFSRLCGTFRERRGTPNQLPEDLVSRFILALSNPGDTVLNPYAGSGTVPAVAAKLGRKGVGIEIVPAYHRIACDRLAEVSR